MMLYSGNERAGTSVGLLQGVTGGVRGALREAQNNPNAAIRKQLAMDDGEPCLVVLRRTWSQGRPVTLARLHHPGSRYELTGNYTPSTSARTTKGDVVELEKLQK